MGSKKTETTETSELDDTSHNVKYKRRAIVSQWKPLEMCGIEEDLVEGVDYIIGGDYSALVAKKSEFENSVGKKLSENFG